MKKALYSFIVILFLHFIRGELCDKENVNVVSDCKGLEPEEGDYQCCFFEIIYEGITERYCSSVTNEEYSNLDNLIEKFDSDKDVLIDCGVDDDFEDNNSYIKISLFYLELLLLF